MTGLDSHENKQVEEDANATAYNAQLGMKLFLAYLVIYVGYVGMNAFYPSVADMVPFAGINVATWYGMGLIFFAILIAFLYAVLCRSTLVGSDAASLTNRKKEAT